MQTVSVAPEPAMAQIMIHDYRSQENV
jgi:hypothetical protein